ncbi:MAG: hypothetical protein ACLFR7_06165 [Opitutales bacterium]
MIEDLHRTHAFLSRRTTAELWQAAHELAPSYGVELLCADNESGLARARSPARRRWDAFRVGVSGGERSSDEGPAPQLVVLRSNPGGHGVSLILRLDEGLGAAIDAGDPAACAWEERLRTFTEAMAGARAPRENFR